MPRANLESRTRSIPRHKLWLAFAILALTGSVFATATATAQTPAETADLLERVENLSPAQRALLMERLRGAPMVADSTVTNPSAQPIDDRFEARPLGQSLDVADSLTALSSKRPQLAQAELRRFGQSLFDQSPETFSPGSFGPVPADYVIGVGDELVVEIWGDVSLRDTYRVDRSGSILVRDAGRITLTGMTLDAARRTVERQLARVISGVKPGGGGSTFVDVTMGRLRAIRVFVIGEATRPGGYEVSAVSTVFQALYAAGGPSEIGSMRAIQLIRNNRITAELDLYEWLTRGLRTQDLTLRDGDTVFIPVTNSTVTMQGEVRRPAIFELKPGEGVRELVAFAGGLGANARADLAHVERVRPHEDRAVGQLDRLHLDLSLEGVFDVGAPSVPLADGDRVTVLPLSDRVEAYVSIGGSVGLPGRYGYESGMRLSDLVQRSQGLWRDAYRDRAVLVRVRDDYTRQSIPVNLSSIQPDSAGDVTLAPMDSLHVFSREIFQEERMLSIHGEVRVPGEYPYFEDMTLQDLVLAAGGLLESAEARSAQVSRVTLDGEGGDGLAELFDVELGRDGSSPESATFGLSNHDHVFVRKLPGYELQRNVIVEGEVRYPGVYTLHSREERLSSVIARAGGLLDTAYPTGFRFVRSEGDVGNVGLDLAKAMKDPGGANDIILMAGDEIVIPPQPMSVRVVGAVGFPTSVVFEKGKSIGDYVKNAGGFTRDADKGGTKIVYPNGLSGGVRRLWPDPGVKPGSTIFVPSRDPTEGVDWGQVIVGTTSIISSLATIYLVIDRTN